MDSSSHDADRCEMNSKNEIREYATTTSTPMNEENRNAKMPKAKTKLDFLAEQVLSACGLKSQLAESMFHNAKDEQPYLLALEKLLEINHQICQQPSNDGEAVDVNVNGNVDVNDSSDNNTGTASLMTCTDVTTSNSFSFQEREASSNRNKPHLPEYWSPPMLSSHYDSDEELPCLEDAAPFTREFYIAIGQMIVCALSSPLFVKTQTQHTPRKNGGDGNDDDLNRCANVTNEMYSLYCSIDAVRVLHIISVLMDFNVHGYRNEHDEGSGMNRNRYIAKRTKLQTDSMSHAVANDCDFLDMLLYYTEGSTHVSILDATADLDVGADVNAHANANANAQSTLDPSQSKSVNAPLINSIFKHFSNLPLLEHHVHVKVRSFQNISQGGTTMTSTAATFKIAHMKKTELFQERLEQEFRRHLGCLEKVAGIVYEKVDPRLRAKARLRMGNVLHTFVLTNGGGRGNAMGGGGLHLGLKNTSAAGVDSVLKILLRILRGFTARESEGKHEDGKNAIPESYQDLVRRILLPLHKPSGMVLWRDQKPLLDLYHKTLVQCIGVLAAYDKTLIDDVIKYIIHPDVWPVEGKKMSDSGARVANTPKLVLLLHEIDTFLDLLDVDVDLNTNADKHADMIVPLVLRICSCISSDNSRSAERALELFKNQKFKALVEKNLPQVMKPLLRALCRVDDGMEIPWNPTVRKMTLLVLKQLQSLDNDVFEECCKDQLFEHNGAKSSHTSNEPPETKKAIRGNALSEAEKEGPTTDMTSLSKSMGGWRPPSTRDRMSGMQPSSSRGAKNSRSEIQPPLTITGVAPWAMKNAPNPSPMSNTRRSQKMKNKAPFSNSRIPTQRSGSGDGSKGSLTRFAPVPRRNESNSPHTTNPLNSDSDPAACQASTWESCSGLEKILSYIEKLKPSSTGNADESEDGVSSWAKAQSSESPCLLPSLKFHDLVFGHDLGQGAFSTVRYARLITKGRTRSHWPEYAVKIVSTQKIEELGYEKSINREIGVLKLMAHPSISRLISAFRFQDGAYLVLEYCSGGDLHSLIKRNGSLDEESTRFVSGEVVAALNYIHDLGFVFGDLKPENILISETQHIKLADFGGARPVTDQAKNMIKEGSTNALKTLRDGDWRPTLNHNNSSTAGNKAHGDTDEECLEDNRVEGTTAYLPPEVILGGVPSRAADSWALGCVIFQCIAGRPPLLDLGGDTLTKQKIVTFEISSETSDSDFFLESSGIRSFSQSSKNVIKRLLTKMPSERPDMRNIAEDDFFQGKNIFALHRSTPHHLDAGKVGPSLNSEWSRRQFSSIWAPQPQDYTIPQANSSITSNLLDVSNLPIIDGEEREAYFLSCGNKMLTGISER